MKITYYGHACLGIEAEGKYIIVDPFITENPLAAAIDINALKADYILLTHAHYDHVLDAQTIAGNNGSIIVSNPEITTYYEKKGFKSHYMNHGGSWKFDFGTLRYVNAVHSSSFPDGTYGGNPGGFVIQTGSKSIYIAGDTALTYDMKLIPLGTRLDLAVFPIGGNFTMDAEDAVTASDFVQCSKILGYHYDSNPYIEINHRESVKKFADKGKELLLLDVGEFLEL